VLVLAVVLHQALLTLIIRQIEMVVLVAVLPMLVVVVALAVSAEALAVYQFLIMLMAFHMKKLPLEMN
jgi:hypothetical protein